MLSMNQATVTSQKTLETILDRLDKLAKEVKIIKEKLTETEPPYGSDKWWHWAEKKADEDIKAGNVVKFNSVEDAIKWLNS